MARIISGTAKNIQLKTSPKSRPVTDRAKAAIFSIILDWIPNSEILDLYAGSGSFGIEALSRGAKSAVFVDNDRKAIECIKENLTKAKLSEKAKAYNMFVEKFIRKFCENKFDIVFLDPPYSKINVNQIDEAAKCIKNDGLIILKHSPQFFAPEKLNALNRAEQRKYGNNVISFYRYQEESRKNNNPAK